MGLLFAAGEFLEAGRIEDHGAKMIFCALTLLAFACGGYALESALNQVAAAKSRRSRVNQRGAINRRNKAMAELVEEPFTAFIQSTRRTISCQRLV
jgi:hypothetical protein